MKLSNKVNTDNVLMIGDANSIHFYRWSQYLLTMNVAVSYCNTVQKQYMSPEINYNNCQEIKLIFSKTLKKGIFRKIFYIYSSWKNAVTLKKLSVSCINIHGPNYMHSLTALFFPKKLIITCWGSEILIKYPKLKGYKKWLFDKMLKKPDYITCDSESIEKTIIKNCRGINKEAFKRIYWGIDTDFFHKPLQQEMINARNKLFDLYGYNYSKYYLSSRIIDEKYNIHRIIEWFNNKIDEPETALIIHSIPPKDKQYFLLCKKIAEKNKRILFHVERSSLEVLRDLYWASTITLHFPESDATPVSMLEAIACGLPVVASKTIISYQDLRKDFSILLTDLESLDNDSINNFIFNNSLDLNKAIDNVYGIRKNIENLKELVL